MGGFVKFVYYNENAGFNQEKNQKNHGCTHLNRFGLYSPQLAASRTTKPSD